MDVFAPGGESPGRAILPEIQTELRWPEAALWPVRRPYPLAVPCPVCGSYTRCELFGRQRCAHGHLFGQRAFWDGRASSCWLLLEDPQAGQIQVLVAAPLHWHDDGRVVDGGSLKMAEQPAPEARP